MNITELAKEPTLVKITLDDEFVTERYGDAIEFWVWDRQPIDKYVQMAQGNQDVGQVMTVAKDMILDEKGKPVINGKVTLPGDVAFRALTKVIETLGK